MKKMLVAVTVVAALLFAGCSGAGGGDPKTVLMAFFDAMSKKDIAAAKKLATKESESMFSLMEMGMNMDKDKKASNDMNFEKDKMIIGDAKIEGDKATIEVKDKDKGEAVNFVLRKESGDWKVAFDKGWMTQMAAEKMKEKGMTGALDSLSSGLEKMKDINMDSLKEKMNEGMDKLKEIQKNNPEGMKKLEEAMKKMSDSIK